MKRSPELLQDITAIGAARAADNVAFRCRNHDLTYGQLHRRSRQLAARLVELGIKRGDCVGILAGKTIELPIAVYGIVAAGAAYIPLDSAAPPARLEALISDCGIRVLISEPNRLRTLRQLDLRLDNVIGLDATEDLPWSCTGWPALEGYPDDSLLPDGDPADLAYVIYTSGSTGAPKGIMHTHASGLAFATAAADTYGLKSTDRLSNFPPLHFDQSVFDFFSGPYAGATTVLIPEDVMRFSSNLAALVESERLTVWYSVPMPLIGMLVDGELEGHDLSNLRWILYGGEAFPPKYLRQLLRFFPTATVSNVYGPAETNQCTNFNIGDANEVADDGVPIGPPWAWADVRVVNPDAPLAEEVEEGELLVHSATMMRGYWGGRFPEVFVDIPVDGQSRRYYRTGDFVRRRGDGNLVFLGRRDRMVKLRGQRIELDDVEATINSLPDVVESAVFVVRDDAGARGIHAELIPTRPDLDRRTVMAALTSSLPPAAMPATIEFTDDFPRTTSGKIDRNALSRRRREA